MVFTRVCACGLVAPTLAFIGLLWKALRNFQFELQVRFACISTFCKEACKFKVSAAKRKMSAKYRLGGLRKRYLEGWLCLVGRRWKPTQKPSMSS